MDFLNSWTMKSNWTYSCILCCILHFSSLCSFGRKACQTWMGCKLGMHTWMSSIVFRLRCVSHSTMKSVWLDVSDLFGLSSFLWCTWSKSRWRRLEPWLYLSEDFFYFHLWLLPARHIREFEWVSCNFCCTLARQLKTYWAIFEELHQWIHQVSSWQLVAATQ